MAQLKDLIVNGPSRFIGDVYATTFTGNLAGNANTATSATNAGTVAGLSVHSGRNNEANKIVRTDGNGYLQVGYINSSSGHEKNASNPTYVWGSNSSDSYLRSYQTSSLSVNYATSSGSCSGNAATATKARYLQADNDAASPRGALLRSGSGRADTSPSGDTWIFWDELGGTSSYWGIRHNQANNSIGFCGAGSEVSNINLETGKITSKGFILTGSSSSYVLLGNGGHAAISGLSVNYANSSGSCSGNAATATNASSAGNADKLDGVHYQNILERQYSGYASSGTATGWFRIAETLVNEDFGPTFLLAIQRSSSYIDNESYLFSISISFGGGISITQLSGYANISLITKIRVDWDFSQIAYVDLYINTSSTNNNYYWYTVGCAKSYTTWTANPTLVGYAHVFTTVNGCKSDKGFTGYLTGTASSASKWVYARTITLTGSVTGSVSIDGSQNVSLATTTNHTHNYAGSSSAGGSANSALTLLYNNILDTNYGNYAVFQQFAGLSDLPHSGWFNSIKMLHNNSAGYFTEIATSFTGEEGMWRRALRGGTQVGWYKMLDSGNYNSYAPKLDGTGATGTWGINISGNAATATKLATARTIWGQSFDGTGNVGGSLSGVGHIQFSADNSYSIGTTTVEAAHIYTRQIWARHLNASRVYTGDTNLYIGYSNTAQIKFFSGTKQLGDGSNERMTILTNGNVGIGTASPSYKLHVNGDGYFVDNVITEGDFSSRGDAIIDGHAKVNSLKASNICIECDNSGNSAGHTSEINNYSRPLYIQYSTSNNCCICYGGGNVGIGITSPTYKLHVYGDARIDGTISCIKLSQTSDIKYKTNIKQIEYEEALKIIENLNPVTWDWNENTVETGSSSGFVAQEAKEFIPNAISRDNENNLSLDYTQLHSYEIKVIQEQQKEIIKLKEKLKILEKLIS